MVLAIVSGLFGLIHSPVASAADADLAKSTPSGAVFFAEISGLDAWIDKLQHSEIVASLPSNPQVQAFYASAQGRKGPLIHSPTGTANPALGRSNSAFGAWR